MAAKQITKSNPALPRVFDMSSQECLWSRIGAVEPRLCQNAFDCLSCPFDRLMQRKKRAPEGRWTKERWLKTPAQERYCRHMLSGRMPYKLCTHGYQCSDCAYDQMLDDEMLYSPESRLELGAAGGFAFAENYYYHPGHIWARVEYGGRVRVGLDDFAARLFGPADGFSLPPIGASVSLGAPCSAFSRGGKQAALQTPLNGVVVARNPKVMERAAQVVDGPYNQGWLLLLEPVKLQRDLTGLISGSRVPQWLEEESQRLSDILTADSGQRLAATGGRVLPDVYGAVPGLDWDQLVDNFLMG